MNSIEDRYKELDKSDKLKTLNIGVFLLKKSIYWVFGRYSDKKLILYTILNRLLLLLQEPVVVIIFNTPYGKKPQIVFKSLNSKEIDVSDGKIYPTFGDPELSAIFDKKIINLYSKQIQDNTFRVFDTSYTIAFFLIEYDKTGDLEKAKFTIVNKNDDQYGTAFRKLLEDEVGGKSETSLVFPVSDVLGKNYSQKIQIKLDREFKKFLTLKRTNENLSNIYNNINERLTDESKNKISEIIANIRHNIIDNIYKEKIETTPFFTGKCDDEDSALGENNTFPNFFIFLKTVTRPRIRSRFNGIFHYDLRLVFGQAQELTIKNHYEKLAKNQGLCSWWDQTTKKCLIGNTEKNQPDKRIKTCLLERFTPDEIVENAQLPLDKYERSFIDTALTSGLLGFASTYPTWSRDKAAKGISTSLLYQLCEIKDGEWWFLSNRLASTLCVTHQVVKPPKDGDLLRAFVSPIHVSGITSMAILRLIPTEGSGLQKWMDIYSSYLSVISRTINRRARNLLKKYYLESIINEFILYFYKSISIKEPSLFSNVEISINKLLKVNESFDILASIYPFHIFKVSFSENNPEFDHKIKRSRKIELSTGNYIYFYELNEYKFPALFNLSFIDDDEIKNLISNITNKCFDVLQKKQDDAKNQFNANLIKNFSEQR